jgi:hypothetical protein
MENKTISSGPDILIVSTNTQHQEDFWQKRLKELRGVILNPNAVVLAVTEDWPGGAGNGLGTLYAYHKAQEKSKYMYRSDLYEMQRNGASIAIYHTAGQGKRMYPVTASEFNDKSSIKLPGVIDHRQITILEAVIAQTSRFFDQRKGRLHVFWGDQIFIPSKNHSRAGDYHIEIIGKQNPFPSPAEWDKLGLANYGLLSIGNNNETKLLEKLDYQTLQNLIFEKKISQNHSIATSLGSFSLSPQMTFALLREFENELEHRSGKFDSDPHFWMPLTLDSDTYLNLMSSKGVAEDKSKSHYERMKAFKTKFFRLHSDKGFFGVVDIGPNSYWWDYGSIKSYYQNILKIAALDHEAQVMRFFFKIDPKTQRESSNRVIKDEGSCLINCNVRSGKITNSILIGVNAESIEARNCIIIDSNFTSVKSSFSLFYNVKEEKEIRFSPGTIRADINLPKSMEKLTLYSHQGRDGKIDWEATLPQNPMSFKEAYHKIRTEFHQ